MLLRSYRLRLKTAPETFDQRTKNFNSSNLLLYFKGEQGLTQTLTVPLNKMKEDLYESTLELVDVGNLSLAHVKLDANNTRWKLNWIELERNDENEEKNILNFPINRWLDSNRNQKLDVLINEGPAQLAPIYTIIICTGTISSCTQASIHLALIGDGASTLPLDLNSNSSLIQCQTKHLFQSGSKDIFYISPFESIDVGQLFHLQLWCDSGDKLPYYCESIEVINNLNDEKYFFLVNHWFGPNLEQNISVPIIDRKEEPSVYTISIKTADISDSSGENIVYIHMDFANGKSHEELLNSSETYQIAFLKNNIDFFLVTIDDIKDSEIVNVKVCFVNKSMQTTTKRQWTCAWVEIRDIFYQRNYCYVLSKTLVSSVNNKPDDYTPLEKMVDLPCSKNPKSTDAGLLAVKNDNNKIVRVFWRMHANTTVALRWNKQRNSPVLTFDINLMERNRRWPVDGILTQENIPPIRFR